MVLPSHKINMGRSDDARRQIKRLLGRVGVCHLCSLPFTEDNPPTRDHLIPAAKGGRDGDYNIRLAHQSCNQARGNEPIQYYRMRSLLMNLYPFLENKIVRHIIFSRDGKLQSKQKMFIR